MLFIYPNKKGFQHNYEALKPKEEKDEFDQVGAMAAHQTQMKKYKKDYKRGGIDLKKANDSRLHTMELKKIFENSKKIAEKFEPKQNEINNQNQLIEPNLDPEYWKQNFLFPLALEQLKKNVEEKRGGNATIVDDDQFKFPLSMLEEEKDGVVFQQKAIDEL